MADCVVKIGSVPVNQVLKGKGSMLYILLYMEVMWPKGVVTHGWPCTP